MRKEGKQKKSGSFDEGGTTQKCDGGAENTINRNVAGVIKIENHDINVIDVLEK